MSSVLNVTEAPVGKALRRLGMPGVPTQAVLLYGSIEADLEAFARCMAQAWTCLDNRDGEPCGSCRACQAISAGELVDVLEVHPAGLSEMIRLGAIVETKESKDMPHPPIATFLRTFPIIAPTKLVLMTSAHRLNETAVNSLLKLVEEAPDYARFVFTSNDVASVRPTLRSRCVCVPCPQPVPDAAFLEEWPELGRLHSYALLQALEVDPEWHRQLVLLARDTVDGPYFGAVRRSERLRQLAEDLAERTEIGARNANAQTLAIFAELLATLGRPEWGASTAEAHRRIVGNAQAAPLLDALFSNFRP